MPGQAIAVTCTWITTRSTGSGFIWEDIWDASMSIDTGRSWAWGNVGYGSSPNKYSFRGVLIHETGHVAGLGHESYGCGNPPASKPTMCATADIEDTYQFRTLESSDKYSVDYWY